MNNPAARKWPQQPAIISKTNTGVLCTLEGPTSPPTINTPLREGKGYLYEGGLRVPLIVKWPGSVRPGTTVTAPASSYDLFPTLLAACEVKSDATPDGVSLLPALREQGTE